jgi:DNA polymerase-3 subunit gamma/tau
MTYQAFALKWRPKTFNEVVGQKHITTTLENALKANRIAHAYLFSGPRGTGKTSLARILAKSLNCLKSPGPKPCNKCQNCLEIDKSNSLDVLEIDGASRTKVEDMRTLLENVKLAPSNSKYKIYIIDEVHMLSTSSFNALLKTLEEPPPHVKFIFATTQPSKILATVISRCQRYDFRRITTKEIADKLKNIAKAEKLKIDEEAVFAIARSVNGGLRDAESLLDQISSYTDKEVVVDDVNSILGAAGKDVIFNLTDCIIKHDTKKAIFIINDLISKGREISVFLNEFISHIRDMLVAKKADNCQDLIDATSDSIKKIKKQAEAFSLEELLYIYSLLSKAQYDILRAPLSRVPVEMLFIKLTGDFEKVDVQKILTKIDDIESNITSNNSQPAIGKNSPAEPAKKIIAKEEQIDEEDAEDVYDESQMASLSSDFNRNDFKSTWDKGCQAIKTVKTSVGLYISEGEPINFDDKVLTVGFYPGFAFHRESLEVKANKKLIQDTFSELLGKKITINLVDITNKKKETPQKTKIIKPKTVASKETDTDNPIVSSAQKLFGGLFVNKENKGYSS